MPESIIQNLGLSSLSPKQNGKIMEGAADLVEQRLLLRLFKSLSDEKRDILYNILKDPNPDKFTEFVSQESPDFVQWAEEESQALKQELESLGQSEL